MRGDQCVWVIWCGGVAVSVSCGVSGFQRSWCYPNNDPKPKSVTKSNPKTDGVVGVVKRVRGVDTGLMFTPPAPVAVVHGIVRPNKRFYCSFMFGHIDFLVPVLYR